VNAVVFLQTVTIMKIYGILQSSITKPLVSDLKKKKTSTNFQSFSFYMDNQWTNKMLMIK